MTGKVFRTAQGQMVDLGALQLKNEKVRAVGNMGVNARGDRVNDQNESIDSRNQQVNRQYQKQVAPSRDVPAASARAVRETAQADAPVVEQMQNTVDTTSTTQSGLAGAIARAQNKGE